MSPTAGYDVKLTDEDRYQFLLARRKRDVVQGKPGVPRPEEKKDAKGPPFSDKVLEKALEYVRGELAKKS